MNLLTRTGLGCDAGVTLLAFPRYIWLRVAKEAVEMIVESIRHASLITLLGLFVSAAPMAMGIVFAIRPNERRLALMRPLSLAGIFAAVCSLLVGIANGLRALATADSLDPERFRFAALVLSETVVPTFVAFACLTVAWLCVAVGMRKHS